jgi:membrane protein DedA with SNARE-associated domain
MVYLPIYDVRMPTNVDLYIGELRKVVEFEILNPAGIIRIWDPTFTYAGFLLGIERKRNLLDDLSVYIIAALTLALFLLSLTCCVALCRKF